MYNRIMKYENFELEMSDGNKNFIHQWSCDDVVEFVVVFSHGMAEHGLRYEEFASYVCENNGVLIVEDHRGHGKTAALNGVPLGWICDKGGFFRCAEDIYEEILYAKKKYPGKKIILASHSFGSFVAQYVIENHGQEIDKAILMGTAGPRNALVRGGLLVAALVRAFKGSKYVSPLINELSFGSYNARYKNPRTEFDWISSDPSSVDLYMMDKMCGFDCSCGFMYDLLCGFLNIHSKAGLRKVPSDLPVFICCGKDDPVGSYGKTVKKLADAYRKNGVKDVTLKIYDGMRHELLNDRCRYEVIEELVKFMKD